MPAETNGSCFQFQQTIEIYGANMDADHIMRKSFDKSFHCFSFANQSLWAFLDIVRCIEIRLPLKCIRRSWEYLKRELMSTFCFIASITHVSSIFIYTYYVNALDAELIKRNQRFLFRLVECQQQFLQLMSLTCLW